MHPGKNASWKNASYIFGDPEKMPPEINLIFQNAFSFRNLMPSSFHQWVGMPDHPTFEQIV